MKSSATIVTLLAVLFSFGCANPGVVKLSPDTYIISRVDRAGIFGNAAKMKADVIREANDFAEQQGRVAIPITLRETPVAPGHFATVEYQFRVVPKDDPEARRTALTPRADVVIERTDRIDADITNRTDGKPDLYAELTKLDDLRKRGILTEEEFEAQKSRLLRAQ